MTFIRAILVFLCGLALIIYREPIKRFTGSFSFAEQYLGIGGTYTLFTLIGLVLMLGSILYAMGVLDGLFLSTFGIFLPQPGQ